MSDVILHQFPYSHFNDKARWGLAWKGIAHERRSYLPGPHMPAIRKLSGQVQTPVLDWKGKIIAGSAAILDHLERQQPEPALYPADDELRREALELQDRLDREVGPATRTAFFSVLIQEPDYLCQMFSEGKPGWKRTLYRGMFPVARRLMARGNQVDSQENIDAGFERTEQALVEIEKGIQATGYLVGDRFSVGDLTAACLLAPLVNPSHPDMARPEPTPSALAAFTARYRERPAVIWAREMYAKHRPV